MFNREEKQIFAAVEIGTAYFKVMVAEMLNAEDVRVLGYGSERAMGMRKGEVVDRSLAAGQLQNAFVAAAESMNVDPEIVADLPLFVVMSGPHIQCHRISKNIQINRLIPISREQVEDLLHQAIVEVNQNRLAEGKILLGNVVNRCFRLSDGRCVFNPEGQYSSTLEAEIQYLVADEARMNTKLGLLDDILGSENQIWSTLYAPLAVSAAIVTDDYIGESLPLVIDIGGGVTSINMPSVLGAMACEQFTIGCQHLVNDLHIGLNISLTQASNLLRQFGRMRCTAISNHDGRSRMIEVGMDIGGQQRSVPASSVEIIVESRLRELFELIKHRLVELQAYAYLGNNVFLSGGGALIPGIAELAEEVLGRKVRIGRPCHVNCATDIQDPCNNALIGVLRGCYRDLLVQQNQEDANRGIQVLIRSVSNFFKRFKD